MNRAGNGSLWAVVGRMFAALTAGAGSLHRCLKQRPPRRLRLSETLSLGDKRFLAVVQFQHQEFLVGATGNSIALLARLDTPGVTPDSQTGNQENGF